MDYLKRITHCTFCCKDYPAMKKFYGETLGLEEIFNLDFDKGIAGSMRSSGYKEFKGQAGDEWITYYKVTPHEFIELFNIPYNGENDTQNEGFHHVCLIVEDIVEAARDLESKGVKLWKGPKWMKDPFTEPYPANPIEAGMQGQCGSLAFYIQDPEGNEIEIMQYTDDSLQVKCG